MKWKGVLANLLAMLLCAMPVLAQVVTNSTVPAARANGFTVTSSVWNTDALGIYTYLNNTLLPVLNVLTTKGDIYVYTGSVLARQGVGSDGTVLTADSTKTNGITWGAFANGTLLTTKGDLLGFTTVPARLPIGTNGQVLLADSTQATGLRWGTSTAVVPRGVIISWSPAAAGTNTIPSGWLLCDGTNSTPNLIGKFVVGTRPAGSSATPATGGYGAQTVDAAGAGTATHTHTATLSGATSTPSALLSIGGAGSTVVPDPAHTHSFTATGTSNATTTEPSDWALVYIMKT